MISKRAFVITLAALLYIGLQVYSQPPRVSYAPDEPARMDASAYL